MDEETRVARHSLAESFRRSAEGKWESTRIDKIVESLNAMTMTGIKSAGFVGGFLFYARCEIRFTAWGQLTYQFAGNSGGLFSLGVSSLNGQIYSDDFNVLVASTTGFNFEVAPPFGNVMFFDSSGNLLGYLSAVATGTMAGAGGGSGSWAYVT